MGQKTESIMGRLSVRLSLLSEENAYHNVLMLTFPASITAGKCILQQAISKRTSVLSLASLGFLPACQRAAEATFPDCTREYTVAFMLEQKNMY